MNKRAVVLALVVVMVFALAVSASAGPPTGDYFYMDADFTTLPPMGNKTIANVQYSKSTLEYYLFFQPETYVSPYDGYTYIGSIDSFQVLDPSTGAYVQLIDGASAIVPASYVQLNSTGAPYLQVQLGVDLYNVSLGQPGTHMTIPTMYLKVNAFAPF
jgi:hypothetical protein